MRKYLLALALCLSLCMFITLPAAAEISLSFGLGIGDVDGEAEYLGEASEDFTGLFLGFDYSGDRFGAGVFWLEGSMDDDFGESDHLSIRNLYGSWHMVKRDTFQLDLVLSYDWLKAGSLSAHAPMLGLDGKIHLNERWSLGAGFGYAVSPTFDVQNWEIDDASMWKASMDISYQINDRWSVALGYQLYRVSGDAQVYVGTHGDGNISEIRDYDADVDFNVDMVLLGFTYRFGTAKPAKPEPEIEQPKEEIKPAEEPKVEETMVVPEPVIEEKPITEEPKKDETPEEKVERIERINEFLHPIFFHFDKYYLRKDQIPVLEKALEVINANKDLYILIAGHADPPGTNAYNQKLSERRALTVRNWLVKNGVDPKRITMIGYGEEYPYMAQSNDPAWESDRWADVVMTDQVPTKEMGIRK